MTEPLTPAALDQTRNLYETAYSGDAYYWGLRPSRIAIEVLRHAPPGQPLTLLDIGCGEGRNAVFFARNGYRVSAFDLSPAGVEKARQLALHARIDAQLFQADLNRHQPTAPFDIVFSVGALHCMDPLRRSEILALYQNLTPAGGVHALEVFVEKPFVPQAPDWEPTGHAWKSGELFTFYADWRIELCQEEIFDCQSSGIPHQHAVNRMVARKIQ